MKLYQIVLRDARARKKRILFAALGVVIGTMTVIGILTIALAGQQRILGQLEKYGPNLTVIPAINSLDMKLGNLSMGTLSVGENYISESKLPEIRAIADREIKQALGISDDSNIASVAPKLYVNAQVKGVTIMAVGVDPEEEPKVKTWWKFKDGQYFSGDDQALVGQVAAELLELKAGDTVDLNGTSVSVSGILEETGSADDYQLFVPLQTLQTAFNKDGVVSSVDIRALCNACPVEVIANAIHTDIPGVRAIAVKQVAETEMGMLERVNKLMLALAGITLAIGLFGVVNTMMSSVHERIKDIGIMRAVGASRNQIMKAFVYEALIVGIIGGIFGYLAGTALAYVIGPIIFEGTSIHYIPRYLPLSLGLAVLVAIVATLYPAYRATRIRVADSFRSL